MSRFALIILILLMAAGLSLPVAAASQTWGVSDFKIEMGTGTRSLDGFIVQPNQTGQVYLSLPHASVSLEKQHLLALEFDATEPPIIFIIWRNDTQPDKLFQHRLPPSRDNAALYNLENIPGWEGNSTQLSIGLHLKPSQQLKLRQVTLASPTLLAPVADALRDWMKFRPWQAVDINLHTGTSEFGVTPHPMPVFAVLALLLFIGNALWHKVKHGRIHIDWRVAGGLVLASWMALDVFWEMRLWQQISVTREQFAGKTPAEKLVASSDSNLIRFIVSTKAQIPEPDARVVIASRSDSIGMRSAYYMAPLNTYWNRHGSELPPRAQLVKGDYILLMTPTTVAFRAGEQQVALSDGSTLRVEQLLRGPQGILLRVTEP